MTKRNTKRALLLSALSLLLCVSMLVGSTFAWFTDSVTSTGNVIKSGTLDVTMEWKDATATGKQLTYKDASQGAIFSYDKWEPGYVEAKNIKIGNAGTLALKYQLNILATGEVSKLADVIDVYYAEGEYTLAGRDMSELTLIGNLSSVLTGMSATANGDLLQGETDTVTLALKMQESANNDYQGLSIGSEFAVQLMATQLTAEDDSFDNQYDKMATIDTEAELLEALAADYDLIQLGANIEMAGNIEIPAGKTLTIDLAGYTMSQAYAQTGAYALITNKGNLTIDDSVGTGKVSYKDIGSGGEYASNTISNQGTLNVRGGMIENTSSDAVKNAGYPHAIDAYQGSTTNIYGGTVKSANYDSIRMFCNSETLATTVNIYGGTIINRVSFQDPAASRAGYGILNISGGKFITTDGVSANVRLLNFSNVCSNMKATVTGGTFDKGFKTQNYVANGVKTSDWLSYFGATDVVTDADGLQDALDNADNGDIIMFAADISGDVIVEQKANVKITVDGNGKTLAGSISIDGKSGTILTAGLTIKNVNFDASAITTDASINMGIKAQTNATRYVTNLTVQDCTFTGTYPSAEQVGIKTYTGGGENLVVERCVATNMHSLAQIHNIVNVKFDTCEVVNCKNGISVGSSRNAEITNCDIATTAYGIRCDGGETDSALVITDCDITANIPVVIRKVTKGYALTVNGENTIAETNTEGLWCVAATNEYGDVDKAGLTAVGANVTVVVNDSTLDQNGIFIKE